MAEPVRQQMTVQYGSCALIAGHFRQEHTHTHTNTHLEYVILIAFPRQQPLRERASLLRYKRIACF